MGFGGFAEARVLFFLHFLDWDIQVLNADAGWDQTAGEEWKSEYMGLSHCV